MAINRVMILFFQLYKFIIDLNELKQNIKILRISMVYNRE